MYDNLDLVIDKNLSVVFTSKGQFFDIDFVDEVGNNLFKQGNLHLKLLVTEHMVELGLLSPYKEIFTLTSKGLEIYRNGGWIKFQQEKLYKAKYTERKERIEFQMSKWKRNTFWPLFILALFGGIYSAYDLISKIDDKSKTNLSIEKAQAVEKPTAAQGK